VREEVADDKSANKTSHLSPFQRWYAIRKFEESRQRLWLKESHKDGEMSLNNTSQSESRT
jgi:hypothetical protein